MLWGQGSKRFDFCPYQRIGCSHAPWGQYYLVGMESVLIEEEICGRLHLNSQLGYLEGANSLVLRSQGNQDLKQIPIGLSANSSCVSVHILCCYVLYISPMWDSVKESFHKRLVCWKWQYLSLEGGAYSLESSFLAYQFILCLKVVKIDLEKFRWILYMCIQGGWGQILERKGHVVKRMTFYLIRSNDENIGFYRQIGSQILRIYLEISMTILKKKNIDE